MQSIILSCDKRKLFLVFSILISLGICTGLIVFAISPHDPCSDRDRYLQIAMDEVLLDAIKQTRPITTSNVDSIELLGVLRLIDNNEPATDIGFSPDGTKLAVTGGDGEHICSGLWVWDTETGVELFAKYRHVSMYETGIDYVTFNPNGNILATSRSIWGFTLWNAYTGREIGSFRIPPWGTGKIHFTPDGNQITFSNGEYIQFWDMSANKTIMTIKADTVNMAINQNGILATSTINNSIVKLRDLKTGSELLVLETGGRSSGPLLFCPDGDFLIVSTTGGIIQSWNIKTGTKQTVFDHGGWVSYMALSPDGSLLVTSSDNTKLWDVETGVQLTVLPDVRDVTFSPDGTLLAVAGLDNTVQLWGIPTGK